LGATDHSKYSGDSDSCKPLQILTIRRSTSVNVSGLTKYAKTMKTGFLGVQMHHTENMYDAKNAVCQK